MAATTPVDSVWPFDGSCEYGSRSASGWRAHPLVEFVLKVQTRCNLNCDYCYVYNMGDDSWLEQPVSMSVRVAEQLAARIREHTRAHGVGRVLLSFHGGEPLLRGVRPVTELVQAFRRELDGVEIEFSMQTNATLVDDEVARALAALGVRVGVSLDGIGAANVHRLDVHGRPSDGRALAGIAALAVHPGLLNGVLCVIDLKNDPVAVLRDLLETGAPSIDFLLPHGNWVARPPGKQGAVKGNVHDDAPYAEWLMRAFDHWFTRKPPVKIRLFNDLMHLLLGGHATYEAVGLSPAQLVTIEADGSIELVDHIGPTYDGAASTGLDIFTSSFDDALRHPGVVCRQIGEEALSACCRACRLAPVCGAGLITHRWDVGSGYLNPTVYCSDMYRLVDHIRTRLDDRLDALRSVPR